MSYLSKDQLDNYLNNLPTKKNTLKPSVASTPSSHNNNNSNNNNSNTTYQALRNELIYPMKNMNINNNEEEPTITKVDAFEASLNTKTPSQTPSVSAYKPKPTTLGTKNLAGIKTLPNNNNNNNKLPPPIPAKKPAQLSSKPITSSPATTTTTTTTTTTKTTSSNNNNDNKVNVSKPIFNQTLCNGCNKPVSAGIMVSALGKKWHNGCFQCTKCHIPLDKVEFFEKDGQPYCEADYHELFNHICNYCKQIITDTSIKALGKHYHVGHFFCHTCKTPFNEDNPFMIQDGLAYCESDYLKLFGHQCKGCGKYIKGSFIGALGGDWHKECFVCTECQQPFPSGVFHVRDDRPYCERHAMALPQQKNLRSSHSPLASPLSSSQPSISQRSSNPSSAPSLQQSDSTLQQQQQTQTQKSDINICHTCKESLDNAKLTSSAFGKNYHSFHFQCFSCHRPLSSRVPGLWQNNGQDEVICKQCS
ncbi:unnamed protein product [Cunninghamella echinulata]